MIDKTEILLQTVIGLLIVTLLIALMKLRRKIKLITRSNENLQAFEDNGDVSENTTDNTDSEYVPCLESKPHVPFAGATISMKGGVEQFYKMMDNRRSVRKFDKKAVSFKIIEQCILAAATAPSGAHTEPWVFCVISSGHIKEQIREIVETEEYFNYEQRMHRQWTADLRPLGTNHIKEYLTDAPYLIVIFKQTHGHTRDGRRKRHYYNEMSVSIATGILLCALQAAGLSSLVTTPLNCGTALRSLLQRPANEKMMVLLPVGYAAQDCKVPDLTRKSLNDVMITY